MENMDCVADNVDYKVAEKKRRLRMEMVIILIIYNFRNCSMIC